MEQPVVNPWFLQASSSRFNEWSAEKKLQKLVITARLMLFFLTVGVSIDINQGSVPIWFKRDSPFCVCARWLIGKAWTHQMGHTPDWIEVIAFVSIYAISCQYDSMAIGYMSKFWVNQLVIYLQYSYGDNWRQHQGAPLCHGTFHIFHFLITKISFVTQNVSNEIQTLYFVT